MQRYTFRFNMWGLYHRVCEAIKSYVVLYEANRIFDAFIIAGHALETCAILSYCSFKHSNMLTPGASFEPEYKYEDSLKEYSLTLICELVHYLSISKLEAFDISTISNLAKNR